MSSHKDNFIPAMKAAIMAGGEYKRGQVFDVGEIHSVGQSGALSSDDVPPMWQVPLSLSESAARRYKKGNDKGYPIHNWRGGLDDPSFLRDRGNHAMVHLVRLLNGDNSVDDPQGNIDAVTWFCALINEALKYHPAAVREAFYNEPRGEKVV